MVVVYVDVDVVVDAGGGGYAGADEADVTRKTNRFPLSVSSGVVSSSVV